MNIARGLRSLSHRPRQSRQPPQPPPENYKAAPAVISDTMKEEATSKSLKRANRKGSSHSSKRSRSLPQDSAREFPRFSELPFELRSKIFAFALYSSRPISGTSASRPTGQIDWLEDSTTSMPETAGAVHWPALLSVCRESRAEAIMYYEGISGLEGRFKTVENEIVGRMGNGDEKGRNRIFVAGWWWDSTVVG